MTTNQTATKYICPQCDSADIRHNATAVWDWKIRAFRLLKVLGSGFCSHCDATFHYLEPTPIPEDVLAITDGVAMTEPTDSF